MSTTDRAWRILNSLIAAKNMARGEYVNLHEADLQWVCQEAIKVLQKDKTLMELEAPLNVVGDVHGQFTDMMKFIDKGGDPKDHKYLFLGDYVDRGDNSIEVITTLLCYKILYPNNVFLLRGNHETHDISQLYGFLEECQKRYGNDDNEVWMSFNNVFNYLPLAAIISQRIFCVHGGLSQSLKGLDEIRNVRRPLSVPDTGFIQDLLWADPAADTTGYNESERGTSFTFGSDVVDEFLQKNDFDLLCRAHQVVDNGFDFPFYPTQSVVTVFSAPNYCDEFGNKAAMLKIDSSLMCSFEIIEPEESAHLALRAQTPYNEGRRI